MDCSGLSVGWFASGIWKSGLFAESHLSTWVSCPLPSPVPQALSPFPPLSQGNSILEVASNNSLSPHLYPAEGMFIYLITKTCLEKEIGSYEKRKLLDSNHCYLKDQPAQGSNGRPHKNIEMQLEIILRVLEKEQKSL